MLDQPRWTQRYQTRTSSDEPRLLREMRQLASQRTQFGADRIHKLLVARDWHVNAKRVHRLWKREQMQVPRKQHRKRRLPGCSENGCARHRPHSGLDYCTPAAFAAGCVLPGFATLNSPEHSLVS